MSLSMPFYIIAVCFAIFLFHSLFTRELLQITWGSLGTIIGITATIIIGYRADDTYQITFNVILYIVALYIILGVIQNYLKQKVITKRIVRNTIFAIVVVILSQIWVAKQLLPLRTALFSTALFLSGYFMLHNAWAGDASHFQTRETVAVIGIVGALICAKIVENYMIIQINNAIQPMQTLIPSVTSTPEPVEVATARVTTTGVVVAAIATFFGVLITALANVQIARITTKSKRED